jgi:hypothetical protein
VKTKPLPCPFCGFIPRIYPKHPEREGNAFGLVQCVNPECVAKPQVEDGEDIADDRGSDMYKEAAINRWNVRADQKEK